MITDEELLEKLEEYTKNAKLHQVETLQSILQHQAGVHYLRSYLSGYDEPVDVESFKRAVPLSCYDDYADLINQMADGRLHPDNQPLLSVDPLLCFFYSSGTSSMRPKLIPFFDSALSKAASYIAHRGTAAVLRRLFPPRYEVNKILSFLYAGNVSTTKGGFKAMAASSYPLHSANNTNWFQILCSISPREVIFGSNVEHQMYCHLLCSLRHCDLIDGIQAAYAAGLITAFGLLESNWAQLCADIESGVLSLEVDDAAMRDSVIEVLGGPQPELAKRIRVACEAKNWEGIVSKVWPNVRYVKCVTTGSMMQYYSKLKYYTGEVPVLGGDYFASECTIGINLDIFQPPEATRFIMLPTAAYFEFLPFDMNENGAVGEDTVDFAGVEVGKMYEVIVTTYRGLYRYRLGDVVRVVGFHNSSPEVEFVMRSPKTSSEIFSEKDLISAMGSCHLELRNAMAVEVVDFTSFMNEDGSTKKLKIFMEVREGYMFVQKDMLQKSISVLRRCCSSLEDCLGGIYKVQRDRGEVGPVSVSIVKVGTFGRLLQVAVENGTPASQYKPPKIVRNSEIAAFMEASALMTVSLNSPGQVVD